MHRIDTATAQQDKFGAGKNGFTGGNPQTGKLPTALDEDFFDALQEELCAIIESAGLILSKGINGQVLAALKLLLQPLNDNLSAFASVTGAADRLAYFTEAKKIGTTPLTMVGRSILSKTDIDDVITYLGALPAGDNAVSASKLQTSRNIAGIPFNGEKNIEIPANNVGAYTKTEVDSLLEVVKGETRDSVTGVRLSAVSWTGSIGNSVISYGSGGILTGVQSTANYAVNMRFGVRYVQVLVNGIWLSISSI